MNPFSVHVTYLILLLFFFFIRFPTNSEISYLWLPLQEWCVLFYVIYTSFCSLWTFGNNSANFLQRPIKVSKWPSVNGVRVKPIISPCFVTESCCLAIIHASFQIITFGSFVAFKKHWFSFLQSLYNLLSFRLFCKWSSTWLNSPNVTGFILKSQKVFL